MTTAAQVQAAYAAGNRTQTLAIADATALAASMDAPGSTLTLQNYTNTQFEANQDTLGAALELTGFLWGKTPATAADLTTITKTATTETATLQAAALAAGAKPGVNVNIGAQEWGTLGAELADNGANSATFRLVYGKLDGATFIQSIAQQIYGSTLSQAALNQELALYNGAVASYKGFADVNDPDGTIRAKGYIVGDLLKQAEDINVGAYHNAAANFIQKDAAGTATYGTSLLIAGGGGTTNPGGGTGPTLTGFTVGTDVFGPTQPSVFQTTNLGDTFIANNAGILPAGNTLNTGDIVAAGSGFDVLKAFLAVGTLVANEAPTLTNVDQIQIVGYGAAGTIAMDLANVSGTSELDFFGDNLTGAPGGAATAQAFTVANYKAGLSIGVGDANITAASAQGGLSAAGETVTLTYAGTADLSATTDSITIKAYESGAGAVVGTAAKVSVASTEIANIQVLDVAASATKFSNVNLDGDSFTTANISGAGDLLLFVTGSTTKLATVNAAAETGNFTYDATAQTKLVAITGGSGTNTVSNLNVDKAVYTGTGASTDIVTSTITHATSGTGFTFTGGNGGDTLTSTVTSAGIASVASNISGGTAADTLTVNVSGVTNANLGGVLTNATTAKVYGGLGGDTITLGHANNAAITLTYKAAVESNAAFTDTVTGFVAGDGTVVHDLIDLSAIATTAASAAAKVGFLSANVLAPVEGQALFVGGNNVVASLNTTTTQTVVYVDANNDGVFNANTDMKIVLAGDYVTPTGQAKLNVADFVFHT